MGEKATVSGRRWLAGNARRESRAPEAKSHSVTVRLVVLWHRQSYRAAEDAGVDDSIYTSLRRFEALRRGRVRVNEPLMAQSTLGCPDI